MKIAFFLVLPILILPLQKKSTSDNFKSSDDVDDIKCIGNNTFVTIIGKCRCKKNFPFGDPNSERGCWNCNPPCGSNSICYEANKCKCLPGFYKYKANSESCRLPIPEILSADPQNGPTSGGTKVVLEIKSPLDHKITDAFCRFGPFSVRAEISNNSSIICISPFCKKGKMPLAVSFDSSRWSEEKFFFSYYSDQISAYNCILLFTSIFIFSLIGILIIWFLKSNKEFLAQSEETLPLNQWHMNQGQEIAADEKGFLDFMKNIVFN